MFFESKLNNPEVQHAYQINFGLFCYLLFKAKKSKECWSVGMSLPWLVRMSPTPLKLLLLHVLICATAWYIVQPLWSRYKMFTQWFPPRCHQWAARGPSCHTWHQGRHSHCKGGRVLLVCVAKIQYTEIHSHWVGHLFKLDITSSYFHHKFQYFLHHCSYN